jgi:NDP-hexose C3-ketoreductase / dTDP-4-oxo-2-deoxy-alpha-D-pentos-2-ene 2,3-reductase
VRYVGSSNFAGWHLAQAQEAASRRHFLGLVSEQCIYNLLTRHVELEVVPAAQAYGLGIIPWSPLHGGLLSGAIRKQADGTGSRSNSGRSAESLERHRPAIEAYEKLCADLGEDPANVALAWLLSRPGVTAPIVGPRTVEQLDGPLRALELTLSDETLSTLDELFPAVGSGGPGPEAWAW